MGVGAEGVDEFDAVEQVPVLGAQGGDAGPGGVDVHPGAVVVGGGGDGADGVDRAGAGGADGRADQHGAQPGGDVGAQQGGERVGGHRDRPRGGVDDDQGPRAQAGDPHGLGEGGVGFGGDVDAFAAVDPVVAPPAGARSFLGAAVQRGEQGDERGGGRRVGDGPAAACGEGEPGVEAERVGEAVEQGLFHLGARG